MVLVKRGKTAQRIAALSLSTVLLFSNTAMAAAPLLKVGSTGDEVREVQEALKRLEYYQYDRITGYYGALTRDAVMKFQSSKGLSQDGIVGENTKTLLLSAPSREQAASRGTREDLPLLREGDSGQAVIDLQKALKAKGYYTYPLDGDFGPGTQNAVMRFQEAFDLGADGVVGERTWALLLKSTAVTSSVASEVNTAVLKSGNNGQGVTELQKALKDKGFYLGKLDGDFGPGTARALKEFQRFAGLSADGVAGSETLRKLKQDFEVLKKGSEGEQVSYIQQKLKESGFYDGRIDGDFGPGTVAAIKDFQKSAGISSDGVVGSTTIAKLQSDVSASRGSTSGRIQRLSWSTVSKLWSRNVNSSASIATIIDYDTGISFRVKRSGGTNHADVEPLTAKDTATFKRIFGGQYSWERRAVIVVAGGKRIAASMAGMAHAGRDDKPNRVWVSRRSDGYGSGINYDAIKGNNMDGHFDVHFYGSRTHVTNRVDKQHQAQIARIPVG